jgi:pyridoxine/pyridoxamine 5'-phosphate oxidase
VNPLDTFFLDQARARELDDPTAALCVFITKDSDDYPTGRTLVLRNIDGQLGVFINKSSPKWNQKEAGISLQTYWPSVEIQYRIKASCVALDPKLIKQSWKQRPETPKKLDWFYQTAKSQSENLEPEEAINFATKLKELILLEQSETPDLAAGLLLEPFEFEKLELRSGDLPHNREKFVLIQGYWRHYSMVP